MQPKRKPFHLGIGCIGSGVGQAVIASLRLTDLPVTTIGLGTNPLAFGAYDCDQHVETGSIYDPDYVDRLIEICLAHGIALLIPGLDDEALLLARNEERLTQAGIGAIVAGSSLIELCRDKQRLCRELDAAGQLFVKTWSQQDLAGEIAAGKTVFPLIAKPRDGCASRGVLIVRDAGDLVRVPGNHILQELAIPHPEDPYYDRFMVQLDQGINPQLSELSIQLVTDQQGRLIGRMVSHNRLNNGVPIEVIPFEDASVWEALAPLLPKLVARGLRGPLNIQGRKTANGLKLFEMNPRFTGITGLRALMGFNEVAACVTAWVGIDRRPRCLAAPGRRFGIRQTADRALPLERNPAVVRLAGRIAPDSKNRRKTVLITGSCGYLGRNLIRALLPQGVFDIWAFHTHREKIGELFDEGIVKAFDARDLQLVRLPLGKVDLLLHLGFARPHAGPKRVAESLRFTGRLFSMAARHHVPAIINVSSQSVYDRTATPPWTEEAPVAPLSPYAQAKYATELLLQSLKDFNPALYCTSIRLATLAGGADGLTEVDFLSRMVRQACTGRQIVIRGGEQPVERIDIRDAVSALAVLLRSDPAAWKPVYNLGPGEILPLARVAQTVIEMAVKCSRATGAALRTAPPDAAAPCGLDSSRFREDMQWRPRYTMRDTIESLFRHFAG